MKLQKLNEMLNIVQHL